MALNEQQVIDLQTIDEIITGPQTVELHRLEFHISAPDALKVLDMRFGVTTTEEKKQGLEFRVWRNLKLHGLNLRIQFYTDPFDSDWNRVTVFGLRTRVKIPHFYLLGPAARDCYVHLLDVILPPQHHTTAIAMGQHDRLGSQSWIHVLPEALFRTLMQSHLPTLEHWDCEKEAALEAETKQQEFELTKGLLDELVTHWPSDSVLSAGQLFFSRITDMRAVCVALDQRFSIHTVEDYVELKFDARRMLHINGQNIQFKFTDDQMDSRTCYIRVRGLGQVTNELSSLDLSNEAFVYFLDALFRREPTCHYEIVEN